MRMRDHGLIQSDFTQRLLVVLRVHCIALSRRVHLEQWLQRTYPAHGMDTRSNRSRRPCDRPALGTLEHFAQLAAISHFCAVGPKRLESGLRLSIFRPYAQRKTRAVNSPVLGIVVRIENLERRARFEYEPVNDPVIVQPSAHRREVGGGKLPLHLAPILVTGVFLSGGMTVR